VAGASARELLVEPQAPVGLSGRCLALRHLGSPIGVEPMGL
jgi:hypothetical protein